MKRAATFFLSICILSIFLLNADAAVSFSLPEPLKTVAIKTEKLGLPEELPPYVQVNCFTVNDNGTIHLELSEAVPRLKILEKNTENDTESTIFMKKNISVADAYIMNRENTTFIVRMIWKLDGMDFVREYSTKSGSLSFSSCYAYKKMDPEAFAPYTSAVRALSFTQNGIPTAETWSLDSKKSRFCRTATYDKDGTLYSVRYEWESVRNSEYQYLVEADKNGEITALTVKDWKNAFYAVSSQLDENPDAVISLSFESLDSKVFTDTLESKYPKLALELINYSASVNQVDEDFMIKQELSTEDTTNPTPASLLSIMTDSAPSTMTDLRPSTMTDLAPSTMTVLAPSTMTVLAPSTMTDIGPSTMTDLAPSTMTDLGPSTMTDLPAKKENRITSIPSNTRLWSLNFSNYSKPIVHAFITSDPLLIFRRGKVIINPKARDINGKTIKLKKGKFTTPVLEISIVE